MQDVRLSFGPTDNQLAYSLYESLLNGGVGIADLDIGYNVLNINGKQCDSSSERQCMKGEGDGMVDPEEVFEFALNNYDKYRDLVDGVLGRSLPWSLDDHNPDTDFDDKMRNIVLGAIDELKIILNKKGIKEGSEEYDVAVAFGLLMLLRYPREIAKIDEGKNYRSGMHESYYDRLEDHKIEEFERYILKHDDFFVEYNSYAVEDDAIETLKMQKGKCTMIAKVYYAMLKLANLKPQFLAIVGFKAPKPSRFFKSYYSLGPETFSHMSVGLDIGGRYFILDPTAPLDKTYFYDKDDVYRLSLRNCVCLQNVNIATQLYNKGDEDGMLEVSSRITMMDRLLYEPYFLRCMYYGDKKNYDRAIAECERAAKLSGDGNEVNIGLGITYKLHGDTKRAHECFKKICSIYPASLVANELLCQTSVILDYRNEITRNIENLLRIYTDTYPETGYIYEPHLMTVKAELCDYFKEKWESSDENKRTAAAFSDDTGGLDISKVEALMFLSYAAWNVGKPETAVPMLKKVLASLKFGDESSDATLGFINGMMALMPPALREHSEIIQFMDGRLDRPD